jgi:hypothetical protein
MSDQPIEEQPFTPCPACGTLNTPGHHFCNECGGTLPPPSEPDQSPDAEPEPDLPITRRWARLGRSPFWYGNLFVLILIGMIAGMGILRLSAPDQFHRIAETLWVPGRRIALPLLDALPGKWINRFFGIEATPTPEPTSDSSADISSLETSSATQDVGSTASPSSTQQAEPTPRPGGAQVAVGGWSHVNLRSGPGMEYDVVGKAPPNSHYRATGILVDGSWCRIEYEGQPAWIACYLNQVRLLRVEEVPYVTEWSRE